MVTMEEEFDWVKVVPERMQLCVSGSIRIFCDIKVPQNIKNVILKFYFQKEYFCEYSGQLLANDCKNILTLRLNKCCSGFGNQIIEFGESYIYKWRLYIRSLSHSSSYIGIGFCEFDKLGHNYCFSESESIHCLAYFDSDIVEVSGKSLEFKGLNGFNENDVIEMEINTQKKELLFYKNDLIQGIIDLNTLSLNLKLQYRLAVTMKLSASIELISFDKTKH